MSENSIKKEIEALEDAIEFIKKKYLNYFLALKDNLKKYGHSDIIGIIKQRIEELEKILDTYQKENEELKKRLDYENKLKGK